MSVALAPSQVQMDLPKRDVYKRQVYALLFNTWVDLNGDNVWDDNETLMGANAINAQMCIRDRARSCSFRIYPEYVYYLS